jgi:hypothetical protein
MAFKLMMSAQRNGANSTAKTASLELVQGIKFRDNIHHLQTAA